MILRKKYALSILVLNGNRISTHKMLFFRSKSSAEKRMSNEIDTFRNHQGNSFTDMYQKEKGTVIIKHLHVFMKINIEKIK